MKLKYPSIFIIETVLGCNLACPDCAVGGRLITRPYGYLSYEQYLQIANKIRSHCKYLYLHIWGEPMLNPDILAMIRHASGYTRTNISTNGNTLTEEKAKAMIDAGVTDVIVSIDGMTQECYAKYRKKGNVDKALQSLAWLAKYSGYAAPGSFRMLLNKIGVVKPKANIMPQFVVFQHNQIQMPQFSTYCTSLGLKAGFKAPYLRKNSTMHNGDDPQFVRAIATEPEQRKKNMMKCRDIADALTILLDGSVVPCCYDHNAEVVLGNIFKESLEEIMNSPSRITFQKKLAEGDTPEFCLHHCLAY